MTQMDYVYCTQCRNFELTSDLTPVCPYSDLCDLCDPEDGRRLYMRPHYTPMANVEGDNVSIGASMVRAMIAKVEDEMENHVDVMGYRF